MTDQELIDQLRIFGKFDPDQKLAADRIEALVKDWDSAMMTGHDLAKMEYRDLVNEQEARIEALVKARRDDALELLAAHGQAQEAYEAQVKAEARIQQLEVALQWAERLRNDLAVCGSQASKLYSEVQISKRKLEAVAELSETFRKAGQYAVSDAIRSALRYDEYAELKKDMV